MKIVILKNLRRIILLVAAIPALLIIFEAGYFAWVLSGEREFRQADVIVVFDGGYKRAKTGFELVDQSYGTNLLISPATDKKLDGYKKKFNPSLPYVRIMEDKARTTFENAVHTRNILEKNGFRSVILITDWYHMPRSYFFLKILMPVSDFRVQMHPVATGELNQNNWHRHKTGWKLVYNEMVEFWGSAAEFLIYRLKGELPSQPPGKSELVQRLKKVFLLKINHVLIRAQINTD